MVRSRKREAQEEEVEAAATAEVTVPGATVPSATAEAAVPAQVVVIGRFRGVIDIDPVNPDAESIESIPAEAIAAPTSSVTAAGEDMWPAGEEAWSAELAEEPNHSAEAEATGAEAWSAEPAEQPDHSAEAESTGADTWSAEPAEQPDRSVEAKLWPSVAHALDAINDAESSTASSAVSGPSCAMSSYVADGYASGASRSDAEHYYGVC